MGLRGKAPQSPGLKVLRGPGKAKKPAPGSSTVERPPMPADMTPAQRAIWDETIAALEADGVLLRRAHPGAIELLARQKPIWLGAVAHVEAHGAVAVVRDDKGIVRFMQQTPEAQLVVKLGQSLKALYETLGLTPAARARLGIDLAPEKESPLAAFITGGRA